MEWAIAVTANKFESYSGVTAWVALNTDLLGNSLVALQSVVDVFVLKLSVVFLVDWHVHAALDGA